MTGQDGWETWEQNSAERWKEVVFLKAIEAWLNGYWIKSEDWDGREYFYEKHSLIDHKNTPLAFCEAVFCKWYVKDYTGGEFN